LEIKEFFTSTFFTIMIGISATIVVLIYFRIFQYNLFSNIAQKIMEKKIAALKNHYIICGVGRVGLQVAEELSLEKVDFVVIDKDPAKIDLCKKRGWLCIRGDSAVQEEVLKEAGIERAKALIIAIDKDADAVFVAVTAKSINPHIFIIARAASEEVASKLEKVGVERIAMPYKIGGYHMANMALRPTVVDFIDVLIDSKHQEMVVEELPVKPESSLVNRSIGEAIDSQRTNVIVLTIKKADKSCLVHPTPEIRLASGDKLILLGTRENIELVRKHYGL